jgi:hypothetical protein
MTTPNKKSTKIFLEMRWHDTQWDKWEEWTEVDTSTYGKTPEEWKKTAESWIDIGGTYEYRIGTRTDVIDWELSYRDNN